MDNIKKISDFDVINQDPSLKNYEWNIKHRLAHFHQQIEQIEKNEKSLMDFAHSYKSMGLVVQDNNDVVYKVFEKGDLLFIFNFHPYQSYDNYRIGTIWGSPHKIVLDSDEARFFGKSRLLYGHEHPFPSVHENWMNRPNYIQIYIPSRTCIVLVAEENESKYDLTKLIH